MDVICKLMSIQRLISTADIYDLYLRHFEISEYFEGLVFSFPFLVGTKDFEGRGGVDCVDGGWEEEVGES